MRTSKILLTALTAALVLGATVSTASARRFAVSNPNFLIVWSSLEFTGREPFGSIRTIRCPVTLDGSLHSRTLSKVSGQLVGYVTSAFLDNTGCAGGSARILTETLPWHIRYDSFIGALPTIERIRVQMVGAAFLVIFASIIPCLFKSTEARPAFGTLNREATGIVRTATADNASQIPKFNAALNSSSCPPEGSFTGTGEVFLQETTTRISVTLVQ